ncbi:hypothetical protein [Facilibium subflavum]|uniref:hypothetical protein n=1 Tax=Facilibium subflavum TaxID=2219058 RepID=UPI000E6588F9|nr:hypothetical protein [Facilibium subflavum]
MGIKQLQDQSKALTDLITLFTEEVKQYEQENNKFTSQYELRMSLEEKRQRRFDNTINIAFGMATAAATFFAGPLGYAIATSIQSIYEASQVDASMKVRVANTILASVTSGMSNYIIGQTVNSNIRQFSMNDPITGQKNYDPDSELYTAKYKAQNCINEFLNTMKMQGQIQAIQIDSLTEEKQFEKTIEYIQQNQNQYAEFALKQAIILVSFNICQLRAFQSDNTILMYHALTSFTQRIQIADSHLGAKARQVYERFYQDKDKIQTITAEQAKDIRQELLKKVIDSEVFAKNTSYTRKYKKLNITNEADETFLIYNNTVSPQDNFTIDREQFFNVIDTKLKVWAYFNDYNRFFDKKLGSGVKEKIIAYIPNNAKSHWKDTFSNDERVLDIIIIYLLNTLPNLILSEPISNFVIIGIQKDTKQEKLIKYLSALYVAITSACYFYLEFYSLHNRMAGRSSIRQTHINKAVAYVFMFVAKMQPLLLAPLRRIKLLPTLSKENREHLNYYGLNDDSCNNLHNEFLMSQTFYNHFNFQYVKAFAENTTPIDHGIANNLRDQLAQQVNTKLLELIRLYDYNSDNNTYTEHTDLDERFAQKLSKPSTYLSLGRTNTQKTQLSTSEEDFDNISTFYENQPYVFGGIAVRLGDIDEGNEKSSYGEKGQTYLHASISSLNNAIGATSDHPEINKAARYTALRKSFLKQRLSLQAYHAKKASIEDVLENIEEVLVLLSAEIFDHEEEAISSINTKLEADERERKRQQILRNTSKRHEQRDQARRQARKEARDAREKSLFKYREI